jgi:hypothetical protein
VWLEELPGEWTILDRFYFKAKSIGPMVVPSLLEVQLPVLIGMSVRGSAQDSVLSLKLSGSGFPMFAFLRTPPSKPPSTLLGCRLPINRVEKKTEEASQAIVILFPLFCNKDECTGDGTKIYLGKIEA